MDDVLVGSRVFCCSCIIVFMRACYPVPLSLVSGAGASVHTWVDEELRVIGQHVAVNIKNSNRSWVHNLDPQQESTFLPWTGGLGSIRGVVLGHLARTKMLGLPDVVELVYIHGVSCVCYPVPGTFVAVQPCCPDLSQNRANVDFSLKESDGA